MEKDLFVTPSQEWAFPSHSKKIAFHISKASRVSIIHQCQSEKGFTRE